MLFHTFAQEKEFKIFLKNPKKNQITISKLEKITFTLKKKFPTSQFLNVGKIICTFTFIATYVYSTYFENPPEGEIRQRELLVEIIDIINSIIYYTFFFLELYISDNYQFKFIFSSVWFVDALTILPILLCYLFDFIFWSSNWFWSSMVISSWKFYLISPFMIGRIGGSFRAFQRSGKMIRGPVFQFFSLTMFIISVMCVFGALIRIIENIPIWSEHYFYFHDSIYMVWATLFTIGYGDYFCSTVAGKCLIIVFFAIGAYLITLRSSELYALLSDFGKERIDKELLIKHIILHGGEKNEIIEFAKEFFNESIVNKQTRNLIIVLDPQKNDLKKELNNVFSNSFFSERVRIYSGDINNYKFLQNINASNCRGIFLLSNFSGDDSDDQDLDNLMKVLAIKNFDSSIKIYAICLLDKNYYSFVNAGSYRVINCEVMTRSILGKSLICQGVSSLLSNLIISSRHKDIISVIEKDSLAKNLWIEEYSAGCDFEIYDVLISDCFIGLSFKDFVNYVFKKFDVIVFGVYRESFGVLLNPTDRKMKKKDYVVCMGTSIWHVSCITYIKNLESFEPSSSLEEKFLVENGHLKCDLEMDDYDSIRISATFLKDEKKKYLKLNPIVSKEENDDEENEAEEKEFIPIKKIKKQDDEYEGVLESGENFKNHIIIFGEDVSDVDEYISIIRTSTDTIIPIIIMIKNKKELKAIKKQIEKKKQLNIQLYYYFGDYRSVESLLDVGIRTCYSCCFLRDQNEKKTDRLAIQTLLQIQSIHKSIHIVAQLLYRKNIIFLKTILEKYPYYSQKNKIFEVFNRVYDQNFEAYCSTNEVFASGKAFFGCSFFVRLLSTSFFFKTYY